MSPVPSAETSSWPIKTPDTPIVTAKKPLSTRHCASDKERKEQHSAEELRQSSDCNCSASPVGPMSPTQASETPSSQTAVS